MASECRNLASQVLSWLTSGNCVSMALTGSVVSAYLVLLAQQRLEDEPDGQLQSRVERRLRRARQRRPLDHWARLQAHAGNDRKEEDIEHKEKDVAKDSKDVDNVFELLDGTCVNAQQLGLMGLEALDTVAEYWTMALNGCQKDKGNQRLVPKLEHIMETLSDLQEEAEALFIHQNSLMNKSVTTELEQNLASSSETLNKSLSRMRSLSGDSFVSASSSLEDLSHISKLEENEWFEMALKHVDDVQHRSMRTNFVGLEDDKEYLAKLHCLRQAFRIIVDNEQWRNWWIENGRSVFSLLLSLFDRDPQQFESAYDNLMSFLDEESNRAIMLQELQARNVHSTNLYDVVFDYILIESFEDLESPPSSVVAVLRSGWLSSSFKQSALQTAIWSIVSAKRRMMKFEKGFKSHFYNLSEIVTPSLAWGFFGPDEKLNRLMTYFKTQVLNFIKDMYSDRHVRFTSAQELSDDIMNMAQKRLRAVLEHIEQFKEEN